MGDYSPAKLSAKWAGQLQPLLTATRAQWEAVRPRLPFLPLRWQRPDIRLDRVTPLKAKRALLFRGHVVWGLISRAYFPAYVPGRRTHYGSVVYALDVHEPDSIFELAWAVNELRANNDTPPPGTEKVAAAIRDDHSSFIRLSLPEEVGAHGEAYFANLCIHRTRLPGGYLHDRLLPLLVAPGKTEWCCILPLPGWPQRLRDLWLSGPPANDPVEFNRRLAHFNIRP